ncbi:MAG TPA: apolipoprotein N-acyltransferase [Planctomycetes bacterium]|nr:apolipoprotein N-acyltransferase [Planctomycetota bacterium]
MKPGAVSPRVLILTSVFSHGLAAAAFPPLGWSPLVLVALAPWFYLLGQPATERGVLRAFLLGQGLYGFFRLGWLGGLAGAPEAGWAGTAILTVIYVLIAWPVGWGFRRIWRRRPESLIWAAPLAFAANDALRTWATGGLAWHDFGYALADWPLLIQSADWGRVFPLTLWVVAGNVVLGEAWAGFRGRCRGRRWALHAVGWGLATGVLLGYGAWREADLRAQYREGPLVIGAQPAITQEKKLQKIGRAGEFEIMMDLLRQGTAEAGLADLYVLPETSFFTADETNRPPSRRRGLPLVDLLNRPFRYGGRRVDVRAAFQNLFKAGEERVSSRSPRIVLGLVQFEPGRGEVVEANRAVLVDTTGDRLRVLDHYDKRRLVPFGEYLPFKDTFFGKDLEDYVTRTAGYRPAQTPGERDVLWDVAPGGPRFAVNICFEIVFPEDFVRAREAGADFVLNISNDGWYDDSGERELVHAQTRFRAVENRRSVVRLSNTGISAIIGPLGEEVAVVEKGGKRLSVRGALVGRPPLLPRGVGPFPTAIWAPWVVLAAFLAAVAGVPTGKSRSRPEL